MADRCAGCGENNRPGARFCSGCGAALALRCEACGNELRESARFCDACGAAAPGARAPVDAARRTVSVVFGDLVGSTAMQEALDPEAVRRIMGQYYEVMRGVVGQHGGNLQKFIGDAVVAVFGTPAVREDDALRAVRCAAAMAAGLEDLNETLERTRGTRLAVRIGVNTGELVISSEGILVGDTMNTAARFEQAAGAGEVLLGEATWRLVRHQVVLEEIAPLALKGKAAPVRVWRLVSATGRTGAAVTVGLQEAPLVGRASELNRLLTALDDAVEQRSCRLVTVIGSPGLGKSRLAEQFGREAAGRAQVLRGHCEPSGEGNAFLPVAEVVREAAEIGEADPLDSAREKLLALGPADDPDRDRLVERVAGVLGIAEPASAQETFWALRRGLEALARQRPLVVVLEDVHWAQPMLLDLLEHLVEWVTDAPVLIVALARPELREAREVLTAAGRRASDVIELAPLDPGESRRLVDGLLGEADLSSELLARVLETTDGNPLFLGELVRMLVDEGALVRAGGSWEAAEGAETFDVPPTIQALLSARIERLRADERAVVERAAVIGQQFYRGAVVELLSPPARAGIDGHLAALRRKEMVEPEGIYWIDEPVYRFHHVLIRDAAYRLLLKEARAVLHERFADWLSEKAGELVGEYEEVVAFHLEQAHLYRRELGPLDAQGRALGERASEHLLSAGRRALAREDLAAAANLFGRALACLEGDDPEILWDLAEAVLSTGDAARGGEVVARYRATVGGDRLGQARASVIEAQLANLTADQDPAATADSVARVAAELHELEDGRGEAKAWGVVAQTNARLGRVGLVEAALDRALTAARRVEDRRRTTAVLAAAPRAALWGPSTVVRASGRCLDVVRILRMTPGNRHVEAIALRCQAVLEAMRGRADAAREILDGARSTLEELGLSLELGETRGHAGMVELLAGQPDAAVEHLRETLAGFESLGADAAAAHAAALLARALVARGRTGDAEEALSQVEFAQQHGGEDLRTSLIALGARGEALAALGRFEDAIEVARRAVELAEPTDALADKADTSMALARVLLAAGESAQANAAAREALGLYEAKGHAVGAELARALAGEVTRPMPAADGAAAEAVRLGNRPPERVVAELQRCHNARDYDALGELAVDDVCIFDHRALGHREIHGRAEVLVEARSAFDASPDLRLDIDEVLDCGERAIALRFAFRGAGRRAGPLEVRIGAVVEGGGGRYRRADYFEPDDIEAILACFAEREGSIASELGKRSSERLLTEIHALQRARDYDRLGELVTDDWYRLDHRALGWRELRGRKAFVTEMRSVFDAANDVREELDEVLDCHDHAIAGVMTWRSQGRKAGESELRAGAVYLFRDGRWAGAEYFDPDDSDGILARYAEVCGLTRELGDRPPERFYAQFVERFARGDIEGLVELCADDFTMTDRRTTISQDPIRGREGYRRQMASVIVMPDARVTVQEVLACDERVIALRYVLHGHAQQIGSEVEIPVGEVSVVEDGLLRTTEMFDHHDTAAMLACFAALGGQRAALGNTRSEQIARDHARRVASGALDLIVAQFREDYVARDHRATVSQEAIRGTEAVRAMFQGILAMTECLRWEIDEVVAACDEVIAVRSAYRGRLAGGGEAELLAGQVTANDGERFLSTDGYDYNDTEAMLARFAELGGVQLPRLGDSPAERWMAEYCRRFGREPVERIAEMYAPDVSVVDRRSTVSQEPARGREAVRAMDAALLAMVEDASYEVREVLACDGEVISALVLARGRAREGGGAVEVTFGVIDVIVDGLARHVEIFDPTDTETMLARFAELPGGPGSRLGDSPPERSVAEHFRLLDRGDYEAVERTLAPGCVWVDHRLLGWEPARGREQVMKVIRNARGDSPDQEVEYPEVLACDDRVVAVHVVWRGRGRKAAAWQTEATAVVALDGDGLWSSIDFYEPADRAGALNRYRELGGGSGSMREQTSTAPAGERPPERVHAELARAFNGGDWDRALDCYAEDCRLVDHRPLGWEPEHGREGAARLIRTGYAGLHGFRYRLDEVLACDEEVIALRVGWSGEGLNGAAFDYPIGVVSAVRDGRFTCCDFYDPDDRQAMIARYVELGGGLSRVGDHESELILAEWCRRYARRDIAGMMEMLSDDFAWADHRPLNWEPFDKEGLRAVTLSAWEEAADIRIEIDEVLAADDRTLAIRTVFAGQGRQAGAFELPVGQVCAYRNGCCVSLDQYDYDDTASMLARFAELSGPSDDGESARSAPERLNAEEQRRYNAHDIEGWIELFAEDYVLVDHRAIGWGRLGRDALREGTVAAMYAAPDIRKELVEVLACDERVIAATVSFSGAGQLAGPWSLEAGSVSVLEDGVWVSTDLYDPGDRQAVIARYAELGGGLSAYGNGPAERVLAEFCRRFARQEIEPLLELVAEDFDWADHRNLGWEPIRGHDGMRQATLSGWDHVSDMRIEVDELLAADERAVAVRMRWIGHALDGGGLFELPAGQVGLVENGRWRRCDQYDYDDTEAMLARFAEVSASRQAVSEAERVIRSSIEAYNRQDADAFASWFAEDVEIVDHRALGWGSLTGRETVRSNVIAGFEAAPGLRLEIDEVLACDEYVIAMILSYRGHAADGSGGGEFEMTVGYVARVEEGLGRRAEQFDPDDRQAIIACYAELGGGLGRLGDSPLELLWAEFCRRFSRRDLDGLLELVSPDYELVDHRPLGWGPTQGREAFSDLQLTTWNAAEVWIEVDEVLAIGERTMALLVSWTGRGQQDLGAGAFSVKMGRVTQVVDGRIAQIDQYEPEDRQAMLERFAELEGAGA